jgi:endonuclease YncB( thermonuclease family)
MFRFICVLCLSILPSLGAAAPDGVLRVIDADTFDVGGVRVRLFGIDAPEIGQPCAADGVEWDCGRWARDLVHDRFEGQQARCAEQDVDRYGRVVAICEIDGVDLGSAIVSAGWAWAYRQYSDLYDLDEKAAAVTGRGLWAVTVQRPSDYRAARVVTSSAPDPACAIKGNISANGRIYHMPGSRTYARTSINEANGELWFCSTAQAEAAGWRAARR